MLTTYIIVAAVAYLLGSIPFGYILVRLFRGEDVRASGSGNIGATNVARKAPGLGLATLILDAVKGYAAITVIRIAATEGWFGLDRFLQFQAASVSDGWLWYHSVRADILAYAAAWAILGHMYPVWLRFRGGKGVATGVGAFAALAPKAILIVIALFAIVVAISRYVSLGSILATLAFPVAAAILYGYFPSSAFALIVAASLLIILKHHANIRRLLAGTEHRFELKRTRA